MFDNQQNKSTPKKLTWPYHFNIYSCCIIKHNSCIVNHIVKHVGTYKKHNPERAHDLFKLKLSKIHFIYLCVCVRVCAVYRRYTGPSLALPGTTPSRIKWNMHRWVSCEFTSMPRARFTRQ